MAIAVKMPQLGESVTEGTVGRWLKQVGDQVEKYEPLLEVISDKVDTEITATDAGTLLSIEVKEDETVAVGTVLCYLGEADEASAPAAEAAPAEAAPEPEPEPAPAAAEPPKPEPASEPAASWAPLGDETVAAAPPEPDGAAEADEERAEPMMTPVVARMIGEHKIDLSQVQGTGNAGRVTKRDIEKFLAERGEEGAPAPVPTQPAMPAAPVAPAPPPHPPRPPCAPRPPRHPHPPRARSRKAARRQPPAPLRPLPRSRAR